MNKVLFLVLTATLACQAAEEEYSKYSSDKDAKVVLQIDNQKSYQRPSERRKVVVKLRATNKQDFYDQDSYNQEENSSIKSQFEVERNRVKYIDDYKDQQYSDDKQYTNKQENKLEKESQPVYVNVNVKKNDQIIYKPEQRKINVNFKINNDKQDEHNNQHEQLFVSKLLTNYQEKPKRVLVNVKLRKDKEDYYDQETHGPRKININVKISKVQEPKVYEEKVVSRETILDKLYKYSKKYTGL